MLLTNEHVELLSLVRQALWEKPGEICSANWIKVEQIAQEQGVLSLLYLGAKIKATTIPSERIKIWRGVMLAGILQNERLNDDQVEILQLLKAHAIKSAILKGTSAARCYSHPDARCLGDVDLLVNQADLVQVEHILEEIGYRKVEHEHGFHVGYVRNTTTIEVHYAASEVPAVAGGSAAQAEMTCFLDNTYNATLGEMEFPVLSDSHQALMQLLHMERHMLIEGIGLRQLCDWAVFIARNPLEHWSNYSIDMLKRCGLLLYASVITKVCVRYLGLDEEKTSWCLQVSDSLADEFIRDVFRGGNLGKAGIDDQSGLFTNRSTLGDDRQNALIGLITTLNKLAHQNFPITRKFKVLLPLCWVYLPARYVVRSLWGLRPKKHVLEAIDASRKRYSLYKRLHLYEVK